MKIYPHSLGKKVSLEAFYEFFQAQLPNARASIRRLAQQVVPIAQHVISQKFEEMIGILCLTESPANLLMWAHYADSHQGFVIEFDSDAPFFDQRLGPSDEFRHLRKVVYDDQRPSMVLSEVADFSPFLTKGLDWSYEAEWRMMLPLAAATKVIGEGPTAIHLFEYPREAIQSVIFGCRMSDSKQEEILKLLNDNDEFKHVHVAKAETDASTYHLLFNSVRG